MLNTDIYGEDCRSRNHRLFADPTWVNFKAHFKLSYNPLREMQLTTRNSTFHGANTTITNEHFEAINALATNQLEWHNLIANIVQSNSTLLD